MKKNLFDANNRHKQLLYIVDEFLVDLECLREMHANVVPVLKEQEKERKKALNEIFHAAEINAEDDSISNSNISEPNNDASEPSDEKKITLRFNAKDIEYIQANIKKVDRAEKLFEQQLIVTLVSRFDEFLGKVLRLILSEKPEWVISADKTISYKDLLALESIDKAIKGIIYKEVEDILRESHEKQIAYIDDKLKIGIRDSFSKLNEFLEVSERRNLFVHTGGIVSSQYIERCRQYKIKNNANQGDLIESNEEYFNSSFLVFFEAGLRIGQASYRRVFTEEMELADQALNNLAVKFMNLGEYSLSEIIAQFDLAIPEKLRSKGTEFLYYAKINRAAAQKFQGKEFEQGLADDPWHVFHPKYSLSILALRERFEEAAELMKSSEIKQSVGIQGLRAWPVFKDFRETEEFRKAYESIFSEEYKPDYINDITLKEEQENSYIEG